MSQGERKETCQVPGKAYSGHVPHQPACSFLLTDSLRGHRARPTIRRSTRREFVSASQICPPPISRSGMIIRPFRPATVGSLGLGGEIHVHIENRMMDRYVSIGRMVFECRSIQTGHPFHSWRRNYCVDVISCPCYSSPGLDVPCQHYQAHGTGTSPFVRLGYTCSTARHETPPGRASATLKRI